MWFFPRPTFTKVRHNTNRSYQLDNIAFDSLNSAKTADAQTASCRLCGSVEKSGNMRFALKILAALSRK